MRFVLDTNVVSELMRPAPNQRVTAWVAGRAAAQMCLTSVSEAELRYGVEGSAGRQSTRSVGRSSRCGAHQRLQRQCVALRQSGCSRIRVFRCPPPGCGQADFARRLPNRCRRLLGPGPHLRRETSKTSRDWAWKWSIPLRLNHCVVWLHSVGSCWQTARCSSGCVLWRRSARAAGGGFAWRACGAQPVRRTSWRPTNRKAGAALRSGRTRPTAARTRRPPRRRDVSVLRRAWGLTMPEQGARSIVERTLSTQLDHQGRRGGGSRMRYCWPANHRPSSTPCIRPAKAGDAEAATRLVERLVREPAVAGIRSLLDAVGRKRPLAIASAMHTRTTASMQFRRHLRGS